jgi:GTP-binding protein HflX
MLEKEVIDFEKSIIVGIITQNQSEDKLNEYLDELEFLTFTAGGTVVRRFSQKMDKPNPKTFVGTGKLEEIKYYIKDNDIKTVIFVKYWIEPILSWIFLHSVPKLHTPEHK